VLFNFAYSYISYNVKREQLVALKFLLFKILKIEPYFAGVKTQDKMIKYFLIGSLLTRNNGGIGFGLRI